MKREKSPAQVAFDEVVKRAVTSILKPSGFKKTGTSYHRRNGSVVQVVNLQSSQGSSSTQKMFYVNIGLSFDALCELKNIEVKEKLHYHECDSRGVNYRLDKIISTAPNRWTLSVENETGTVERDLKNAMELLVSELDTIDSTASFHQHSWFDLYRPSPVSAKIFYVEGHLNEAWQEVIGITSKFSDRQKINKTQYWIEELGLVKLEPMNTRDQEL